jgi:hypothetical protein
MLGSTNFWFGVIVGAGLLWAYRKFGVSGMGKPKGQGQ